MKTYYKTLASFVLVAMAAGCGKNSPSFSTLPTGQSFKQSKSTFNNQLDILWVVDDSGSMGPYQTNLTSNFNSFISTFATKGYDFKISVTDTQAYLGDTTLSGYNNANAGFDKFRDGISSHSGIFTILPTTPNFQNVFVNNASLGANQSGDERAFSSIRTALNSPLNSGFLRPQSFLAVIILSDEDDFSGNGRAQYGGTDHDYAAGTLDTVNSYVSYLDQLTATTGASRRYNVSTISIIDNACLQAHQAGGSIMGTRYMQLASGTNGVSGSICDNSYANVLDQIQMQIATLSTQFYLAKVPQVNTIVVKVNGAGVVSDPTNGWTYNSGANSVMFHGTSIPPQNADINIDYVPAGFSGN